MTRDYSAKKIRDFRKGKINNYLEDDLDWDTIEQKMDRAFRKQKRRISRTRKHHDRKWFKDEL